MKFLIVLATYNGQKYIKEQIDSILNQENVEIDILVGDDNSTDNTVPIIKENFPEISILQNNPGTGSAANNFLKMIKNLNFKEDFDYVAFADQDDIWLPDKMNSAWELLEKSKSELYCSNLTKWDTSNNTFTLLKKDFPQKKFDYLFEGGSAGCTYVFSRHFANKLQEFLVTLDSSDWKGFSHDWLVYFFARSRNHKVAIDGNSYIHYRLHEENVHGHLNKLSFATIKEKSQHVLDGYYQNQIKNYIKYLSASSVEYYIYKEFLGNYFRRNRVIWKYNTQLLRDNKKFMIFALLNLLKFK